jgi:hypothetical protein
MLRLVKKTAGHKILRPAVLNAPHPKYLLSCRSGLAAQTVNPTKKY